MTCQVVKLGDVANMLSGAAFKSQHFLDNSEDGVYLLRGDNVQQGFIRWGDKAKKWRGDEYEEFARYQLQKDDVILAMDRPIVGGGLKLAWIKAQDLPSLLVQRVTRLRGKPEKALTNYLRYALSAPSFVAHIDRITTGANIPHISGKDIASFELNLPSLDTQNRIVEFIAAYDDLIETNRRRIALLEESASLLYREWFVQMRYPGHVAVRAESGFPDGWRRGHLSDALYLQRGFDLPNNDRKSGDIPIYSSTGINGFHHELRVKGPGVVTGRSGTLGVVHYVHEDFWPLNTALWVKEFRAVTPLIAYFMLSEIDLAKLNSGASVPSLDRKVAHTCEVLIPPLDLMTRFGELAEPIFLQSRTLGKANASLASARDALLPKLMSGDIQV
jgi:type I restriction enzyme S subunit